MNIFKEKEDFIGIADLSFEENSFRSLFRLAKQIQTKLEDRGYRWTIIYPSFSKRSATLLLLALQTMDFKRYTPITPCA